MRISLRKTLGRALILAGALALACWGYLFIEQLWFQRATSHVLEQQMLHVSGGNDGRDQVLARPRPGDIIGRIEIPRLHVSVIVLEGSDSRILRIAAGHVPGTALPGTIGNVGIAAHRDSFFSAGARDSFQRHDHPDNFARCVPIPSGQHGNRRS
jgi:hypothetical protein